MPSPPIGFQMRCHSSMMLSDSFPRLWISALSQWSDHPHAKPQNTLMPHECASSTTSRALMTRWLFQMMMRLKRARAISRNVAR